MKVDLDYKNAFGEINAFIPEMQKILGDNERKALSEMGKIVKKSVEGVITRSDIESRVHSPKNSDGTPYTHMKDDVQVKVRKSKTGDYYVSIHGGKNTGHKWHLVSDGWVDRGGTFHQGNKFIERAVQNASGEIEAEIDKLLKAVTG